MNVARLCVDCGTDLRLRHETHTRCIACYVQVLHKSVTDGTHYFKDELEALPALPANTLIDVENLSEPKKARVKRMHAMSSQGMTSKSIGKQFGISSCRVTQILKRVGASRARIEFAAKAKHTKAAHKAAAKEARSFSLWGMSSADAEKAREIGMIKAFLSQRNNAAKRGIAWRMTLAQWRDVWTASGKYELRGRGVGKYCMSRLLDDGGYAVGNVHIQLTQENSREARLLKRKQP